MRGETEFGATTKIKDFFERNGVVPARLEAREYPEETIVVVYVTATDFDNALRLASEADELVDDGFVTVKKAERKKHEKRISVKSIHDERVTALIELLNERSRTSEKQPSLEYVADAALNLKIAVTKRNHLILGRRGVGKTALMLEARNMIESNGDIVVWQNFQTYRGLSAYSAFLNFVLKLAEVPMMVFKGRSRPPKSAVLSEKIESDVREILDGTNIPAGERVEKLVPRVQEMVKTFTAEFQGDCFLFLDDFHYIDMSHQAKLLDMMHGISRDSGMWLKVSGIRHQMRYVEGDPPIGLQPGHDAAVINLDVSTLEEPGKAKDFLTKILKTYFNRSNIGNMGGVLSGAAVDRLVLASGGVPRDFLTLCAATLQNARRRENAKTAGVQDVNESAGETAALKLRELEDDAASSIGKSESRLAVLSQLTEFLLNEQHNTFFRVDFADKERFSAQYRLLQSLMDLRMIHLIRASISDSHHAGRRYEVFMLDLSQYSGSRFKHNLSLLDFQKGHLVLKKSGTKKTPVVAKTGNILLKILRAAPILQLEEFSDGAIA